MTRENDLTRIARPAVIVAGLRSGGTFLAHCLSNHSGIFCDRGESLHHDSIWVKYLRADRGKLLHCLLSMQGYHVSMCKLTYVQAFKSPVWRYLKRQRPPIIWLRRENVIRQSVSLLINRAARGGHVKRPQHTFVATGPISIGLSADAILKQARGLRERDERAEKMLRRFSRLLKLTYREITGDRDATEIPRRTGRIICNFLNVRYEPMRCDLKRVNPQPLSEMISDWAEVEKVLHASEFARYVDEEAL